MSDDRLKAAAARVRSALRALAEKRVKPASFQTRVQPWMLKCFNEKIAADIIERCDRLVEEVHEATQALGYPTERAHALVDYVHHREKGEINQEIGGVMVCLAALCNAIGVDMNEAGEAELARVWTAIDKIRAKHAGKPTGSALPIAAPPAPEVKTEARVAAMGNTVSLVYTNYRDETAARTIVPHELWFGSTEWHPEPQWFVKAFDVDKQAVRDFALQHFGSPLIETPPAPSQEMSAASRDILAERNRQIEAERWTSQHDDQHVRGELAAAAASYAFAAATKDRYFAADPIGFWPWNEAWFKHTDARRDLVKAGALILAEIERLDRAASKDGP